MANDDQARPGRSFGTEQELDDAIAILEGRGMRPREIAEHLGVPLEWVVRGRSEGSLDDAADRTDAESFPASDPPAGPEA